MSLIFDYDLVVVFLAYYALYLDIATITLLQLHIVVKHKTVQKKLVIVSDVEVVLEHHGGTYTNWKRLDNCDMRLVWDGTKWTGSFDSKIDQDGDCLLYTSPSPRDS